MKIELTHVKHAAFASEETQCFSAIIYLDGVVAGEVSNDGHGGPNRYHPREVQDRLDAYGKTLPPMVAHGYTLPMDADLLIGEVLDKFLALRDLKRILKKRLLTLRGGKIYQTKVYPAPVLAKHLADPDLATKLKAEKVLNLLPEAEALELYLGAVP